LTITYCEGVNGGGKEMQAALTTEIQVNDLLAGLLEEFYDFVSNIQRPRLRDREWAQSARERCRELSSKLAMVRERLDARKKAVGLSIEEVTDNLRAYSQELSERPSVARMKELTKRLSYNYEDLLRQVRSFNLDDVSRKYRLGNLKPLNLHRNIMHVCIGVTGVSLYETLLTHGTAMGVLGTLAAIFMTLEVTRRIWPRWNAFLVEKAFSKISRPAELKRINSSTWYLVALCLMVFLAPQPAVEVGVLVLAFGDPAAAILGKLFGRRRLWGEKTLVGTLSFVVASVLATFVFLSISPWGLSWGSRFGLIGAVSCAGALIELFSGRLDDNFTIPVACSALAWLWF